MAPRRSSKKSKRTAPAKKRSRADEKKATKKKSGAKKATKKKSSAKKSGTNKSGTKRERSATKKRKRRPKKSKRTTAAKKKATKKKSGAKKATKKKSGAKKATKKKSGAKKSSAKKSSAKKSSAKKSSAKKSSAKKSSAKKKTGKRSSNKRRKVAKKRTTTKKRRSTKKRTKIEILIARLEAALEENAPRVLKRLNPGASEARIKRMKKGLGVELPESFYALYRWRNGSAEDLFWLDGLAWLNDQSIIALKGMMDGIIDDGHYAEWAENEWWSKGWVGFADDGSGHGALVIDTVGSFGGAAGQILSAAAKEHDRIALAKHFESWLEYVVAVFEQGRFTEEDDTILFDADRLHRMICRGYPRAFHPTEAQPPASHADLRTETRGTWPAGVDLRARWLVEPRDDKTRHWLIALRGTQVLTWQGTNPVALKASKKKLTSSGDARSEHDRQLRRKIKSGFSVVASPEGARRGDCLLVMQTGTHYVGLGGDGRTLAYGKMGKDARGAELHLADAVTGRRRLLHTEAADEHGQTFVHMVDIDADERPVWMLNGKTCRFADGKMGVVADIEQEGKEELFNPHVTRSALDASGRRLMTFHRTGVKVLEGKKTIFRLAVKRGDCEYRHAAISPSGERLALVYRSRAVIYGHADAAHDTTDEIQIYDVESGELLERVPMPKPIDYIRRIGLSPDDELLLIGDYRAVHAYRIADGSRAHRRNAREWAFSPDGELLALAQRGARVELYRTRTRRKSKPLERAPWASPYSEIHETERLAFSRDGSRLLQVAGGRAYLWAF